MNSMKNKKLLLLGIDGMDYALTMSLIDQLPNIRSLYNGGGFIGPLKSVFPPDSIPAWITAYTGLDPSEHGILDHVNYFDGKNLIHSVNTEVFKGRTFWDILGKNGKRVCILNPFMAFPVWDVNGVMVSGAVAFEKNIQVSNNSLLEGMQPPQSMGGIPDFPKSSEYKEFLDKAIKETNEQADFGVHLLKKQRPDIFFQAFLTMDRVQHFLWRFHDSSDPTYIKSNPHERSIVKFYQETDRLLGRYIREFQQEYQIVVISDHGHGMRCTKCFNLNELLRRKGLLKSKSEKERFSSKLILEKMKNSVLQFLYNHDLEDYISVIAKFVPNARSLKKGKHITNASDSIAFASDFTGTNPFGGICINKEKAQDYEQLRNSLIADLSVYMHEDIKVFKWVRRREEIYQGSELERYPDILFEMESTFGVNWALHTEIVTTNTTHKKISGGHRNEGIFIIHQIPSGFELQESYDILDVFPAILSFFGMQPVRKGRIRF